MPSQFTAIYDACVLYPAPLRDLLMHLALTDTFRARWTNDIHDEWTSNVLKNRPDLSPEQLSRTRDLMDTSVRDALVFGYAPLIPSRSLPDADDRHVLAAAICCNASVIVTFNLKDFPQATLDQYGIEAQHPDAFILNLIDLHPAQVCKAAKDQYESLKKPPMTPEQFLDNLLRQGLPQTVSRIREVCNF